METEEKIHKRKRKDYHRERILRKNFKETIYFIIFIITGLIITFIIFSASN